MERSSEKKKENFLIFREKWVRILSAKKKERKERREPVVAILGHSTEVERDVDMATTTVVSSVGFKRVTGPGLVDLSGILSGGRHPSSGLPQKAKKSNEMQNVVVIKKKRTGQLKGRLVIIRPVWTRGMKQSSLCLD